MFFNIFVRLRLSGGYQERQKTRSVISKSKLSAIIKLFLRSLVENGFEHVQVVGICFEHTYLKLVDITT